MNRIEFIQKTFSNRVNFAIVLHPELIANDKLNIDNNSMNIFSNDENRIISINSFLASAFYASGWSNFTENSYTIRKDVLKIIDSGGFQLIKNYDESKKSFTARFVMEFIEKYGDIGIILDRPPENLTAYTEVNSKQFDSYLQTTKNNISQMCDHRSNHDILLINVLHGSTIEEIDNWYKNVSIYPTDGWALVSHPPSLFLFVLKTLYLHSKGEMDNIKALHYLGTSIFGISSIVAYLQFREIIPNNTIISCDSSSWMSCSRYGRYLLSQKLAYVEIGDQVRKIDANFRINKLPCLCPVCTAINKLADKEEKSVICSEYVIDPYIYRWLDIHNAYILTQRHQLSYYSACIKNTTALTFEQLELQNCKIYFDMIDRYINTNNVTSLFTRYGSYFNKTNMIAKSDFDNDIFLSK